MTRELECSAEDSSPHRPSLILFYEQCMAFVLMGLITLADFPNLEDAIAYLGSGAAASLSFPFHLQTPQHTQNILHKCTLTPTCKTFPPRRSRTSSRGTFSMHGHHTRRIQNCNSRRTAIIFSTSTASYAALVSFDHRTHESTLTQSMYCSATHASTLTHSLPHEAAP